MSSGFVFTPKYYSLYNHYRGPGWADCLPLQGLVTKTKTRLEKLIRF